MNMLNYRGMFVAVALCALWGGAALPAAAQIPTSLIPVAIDTAAPIVVNAVKPKPKPLPAGIVRYEGFVMHANTAQITVRAKGSDMTLQTFTLSPDASARMQQIVDRGGYQYGDRVTIIYNTANQMALKIKGRPSRPQ
jgi:hypothetical protein